MVLNSIKIQYTGGIDMICVGIDVAKDKHDCYILNTEGEVLADVFTITNSREGFNILLDKTHSISHVEDKKK